MLELRQEFNPVVWGENNLSREYQGHTVQTHEGSEHDRRLNCLMDKILGRSSSSIYNINFNKLESKCSLLLLEEE